MIQNEKEKKNLVLDTGAAIPSIFPVNPAVPLGLLVASNPFFDPLTGPS